MAIPLEGPGYDPMRQVPTPEGNFRDRAAPPSKGEQALQMWRDYMGDEPMPPHLRKMYGLPPEASPQSKAR